MTIPEPRKKVQYFEKKVALFSILSHIGGKLAECREKMSNKSQSIDIDVAKIDIDDIDDAAAQMPSVSPLLQFLPEEVAVKIPVLSD